MEAIEQFMINWLWKLQLCSECAGGIINFLYQLPLPRIALSRSTISQQLFGVSARQTFDFVTFFSLLMRTVITMSSLFFWFDIYHESFIISRNFSPPWLVGRSDSLIIALMCTRVSLSSSGRNSHFTTENTRLRFSLSIQWLRTFQAPIENLQVQIRKNIRDLLCRTAFF